MGLKNKTKKDLELKYNGKKINIASGDVVDVRDFDVANKDVVAVEKHIMIKNAGSFTQVKTSGDPERDKEVADELKALSEENKALQENLEKMTASAEDYKQKADAANGELRNVQDQLKSSIAESKVVSEKFKEMEDEIEKLRLSVAKGKNK